MFHSRALQRQLERMRAHAVGEWRGSWRRYDDKMKPTHPPAQATCSLRARDSGALEQKNTYDDKSTHTMTLASAEDLARANGLMLAFDDGAAVWCTLDIARQAAQPERADRAAVELIARHRSQRARAIFQYGCDEGSAWRLHGLTSIRDTCQVGPLPEECPPPHFRERSPATRRGWIWQSRKVHVSDASGRWESELLETEASGEMHDTLALELTGDAGAMAVPEADTLFHGPSDHLHGATLSFAWEAARDVCLRVSVAYGADGRLRSATSEYFKHVHWMVGR